MAAANSHAADMISKRQRKANFSDEEVRVLLEGIGQQKDIILSKLMGSLTAKMKKQAWEKIVREVNACGKEAVRTDEDVKKKWKDLKSAVLREEADQKKTGGGGPMKPTPYKDLIMYIIGDRSDAVSGIEVFGTDSFAATIGEGDLDQVNSATLAEATSLGSEMLLQQSKNDNGVLQNHDMASTARGSTSAEVSGFSTLHASSSSIPRVSSSYFKSASNVRRPKRKNLSNATEDDSQLFNTWLSSEITKNKAQTELIELLKQKTLLEITKMQLELATSSVAFDTEQ